MITREPKSELKPYWNDQCALINDALWLPTDLDFRSKAKRNTGSWFSMVRHSVTTQAPSRISFPEFVGQAAESVGIAKTKYIRLLPTKEQRAILIKWWHVWRYTYNQTLEMRRDSTEKMTYNELRYEMNANAEPWAKECPRQLRDEAVRDADQSYFASLAHAKKVGKPAKFNFRRRRSKEASMYVSKDAIKKGRGIYVKFLGNMKFAEELPDEPCDSRLVWKHERWYLAVPYKTTTTPTDNHGRIVALDPGVRTFIAYFSADECGHIGYDDFGHIQRLCYHLDDLISRTSKAKGKRKREMLRAQVRMRRRILALVDEIHWKAARFFVDNFDVILLPRFETSRMVSKLRSKTARAMLTWSHYRFSQRLKFKALEAGKQVVDVTEEYTSKTASWTGEMVSVGGSRVIKSGGITLDRDLNGARGIYIKSLVDTPSLIGSYSLDPIKEKGLNVSEDLR